jgi:hypothetical protein
MILLFAEPFFPMQWYFFPFALTWFWQASIFFCKVKQRNKMSEEQKDPADDTETVFEVDKSDFSKHWQYLKKRENLWAGTLAGIGAAVICLAIWIIIMKLTGYKVGWMAFAEGFGIGYAMQYFGKGVSPQFGIVGGAIALIAWLLGNFFTAAIIFSRLKNISLMTLMSRIDFSMVTVFLKAVIGPVDFLLCAAAVYTAYYIGFKRVVPDNLK